MTVYILCFSLSLLGLYISSRVKNNYLSSITAILALLFPCLLAGLRSLNIGTDLRVYVSPMFKLAILSKNWDNYDDIYIDPDTVEDSESVEIFSDYGNGFSWKGEASRNKFVVTSPTNLDCVDWTENIPTWVIKYFVDKGWSYEHLKR